MTSPEFIDGATPEDQEGLAALVAAQESGKKVPLLIEPLAAFMLISQLQLALRHPENTGVVAEQTRAFIGWLASALPAETMPLVEQGFDPERDR